MSLHRVRVTAAAATLCFIVGCDGNGSVSTPSSSPQHLPTLALSSAITPGLALPEIDGLFPVDPAGDEPDVEITRSQASALALAYVRQYGRYNLSLWQHGLGVTLGLTDLHAGPRVFFARSQYGPVDPRYSGPMHKALGGYYIVTIFQEAVPVLSVAVSSQAGDLSIRANGHIAFPRVFGNEFRVLPIAPGIEFPITPERAARIAAEQTGARVAHIPYLVAPALGTATPQRGRWVLQLERPVSTAGTGTVTTVYVDWAGNVQIPVADSSQEIRSLIRASDSKPEKTVLPRRPGFAHKFTIFSQAGR